MRYLMLIPLWFGVLFLGHGLACQRQASMPENIDIITQILGESRTVISSRLFQTADRYYHGGLTPGNCTQLTEGEHGEIGHEHDHHDGHPDECDDDLCCHEADADATHAPGEYLGAPWYRKILHAVRPSMHKHLSGKRELAELLPWFRVATRVDSHNVQAYEVGAFWLGKMDKPEQGLTFINEGIDRNPEAFELELAKGELLLHTDPAAADRALEKAEQKWWPARKLYDAGKLPDNLRPPEKVLMEKILVFRAKCMQDLGHMNQAAVFFRRAIPFSQNKESLLKRIEEIKNIKTDPVDGI